MELVRQGADLSSAKAYQRVSGAGFGHCHLATEVARGWSGAGLRRFCNDPGPVVDDIGLLA